MNRNKSLDFVPGNAICYSGYRKGQSPQKKIYPDYNQVKEDLWILQKNWDYIRLYDGSKHAELVLEIIQTEKLNLKVMLGANIAAEVNNSACPWGGVYSEETLIRNKESNLNEIKKIIQLSIKYPDIVFSLSAGNEATVDWTDHLVPVTKVIEFVRMMKTESGHPVTFCENYLPWHNKLKPLVKEVDFISIHTYPVWEYKQIREALDFTKENYYGLAERYPDKLVVITEAGWATKSDGKVIKPENVNEAYQEIYYHELVNWTKKEGILAFVLEAFDEPWKGSPDKSDPEKHWGLFYENRKPKKVMKKYYPGL